MDNRQTMKRPRPLKIRHRYWDGYLLIPYLVLCGFGIVMVYSASAAIGMENGGSSVGYLVKQTFFVFLGICCMLLTANYPLYKMRRPKFLMATTFLILGLLVIVKLVGASVNGAQGWLRLGMFSFQPAEFCKLYLIIYLADRFDRFAQRGLKLTRDWRQMAAPLIIAIGCLILIVIQPDVGGAVINMAIIVIILMASEMPYKVSITCIFLGVAAFYLAIDKLVTMHIIHGYQAARFIAFTDPFGTARGAGSQLVNSYYAISNGGIFGVGLGNSIQKMGYLPEPNTDFIMAVTAEELGLVGVTIILVLLMVMICRIIWLGVRAPSMYMALLCYGSAAFMTVEASFNIGGVVGLLPITGVTFPFVSYGGSSMVVLSLMLGIIVQVSSREKDAIVTRQRQPAH